MSKLNTISVGSPSAFKGRGIQIFSKQRNNQVYADQDVMKIRRQRDQLLDLVNMFDQPGQIMRQKIKSTSVLNEQVNRKLSIAINKMIQLDQINQIFPHAKKWEFPLFNSLIGHQVQVKNDNQFVIVGMSNELKMIYSLLFEKMNLEEHIKRVQISPFGKKIFDKIEQLRCFQHILHELNFGIQQYLPKLAANNILQQRKCLEISQQRILEMHWTLVQAFQNEIIRLKEQNSRFRLENDKLQQQKQIQKHKADQAQNAYGKLSDKLYQLQNKKSTYQSQLKLNQMTINNLKIQKQKQQQQNKRRRDESQRANKEKETLLSRVNQLQRQKQSLTRQLNSSKTQLAQCIQKNTQAEQKKLLENAQRFTDQNLILKRDRATNESLSAKLNQAQTVISQLQVEKERLNSQSKKLEGQFDKQKKQKVGLELRITQVKSQNQQIIENNAQLHQQIKAQISKKLQIENAYKKLYDKSLALQNISSNNQSILLKLKEAESYITTLRAQLEKSNHQSGKLRGQVLKEKSQKESIINKLNEAEIQNKMSIKQVSNARAEQEKFRKQMIERQKQREQALTKQANLSKLSLGQIMKLNTAFSDLTIEANSLRKRLKDKQIQDWQKNQSIFQLKDKIIQLESKLKDTQLEYQKMLISKKAESGENNEAAQLLSQKAKKQQIQIQRLAKELQILKDTNERNIRKLKQKDEQIMMIQEQYNTVNRVLEERDQLEENSLKQGQRIKLQLENAYKQQEKASIELSRKYKQNQKAYIQLQKRYETLEKSLISKTNALQVKQAQFIQLKKRSQNDMQLQLQGQKELKQNIRKLQQTINKLVSDNERLKKAPISNNDSTRLNALFQNDVLDGQMEHKQFLTETIQNYMRMRIIKTRMIYRYDPLNRINFHKYIDGVENIVIVVKLQNGSFVAGYSQGCFQPMKTSDRDGLILSLTRKKYFTLVDRNRRAISYDDYYIIFGNSQLRIRSQQNTLFSNFGISNSYYASRGERVNVILGGGLQQREVEIEHYQIYQLTFDL